MSPEAQPDMQQVLMQAQRMQQQLVEAQAQLAMQEVEGTAGAGWSPRR